jgi:MoaA/NifB/PqqE/SkfB family radical SAM enzyme
VKQHLSNLLNASDSGRELLFQIKRIAGRLPTPDVEFPQLINLETSSLCNLSCVHCPPQQKGRSDQTRRLGHMSVDLFEKLMDEIDRHGPRRITLHKDGEPLLHPHIQDFMKRVKAQQPHEVYVTTNAHGLTPEIGSTLLETGIDIVNFSLGAATEAFYLKVRGKGFRRAMDHVEAFLSQCMTLPESRRPRVIAQMIRLPEYPECEEEILAFERHWKARDVEVQIWDKLSWGTYELQPSSKGRYPCFSLWEGMTVNSDGLVSACCMDWRQDLLVGNASRKTLEEIWKGSALADLRRRHVNGHYDELPLCGGCNYWSWQPRLDNYKI